MSMTNYAQFCDTEHCGNLSPGRVTKRVYIFLTSCSHGWGGIRDVDVYNVAPFISLKFMNIKNIFFPTYICVYVCMYV